MEISFIKSFSLKNHIKTKIIFQIKINNENMNTIKNLFCYLMNLITKYINKKMIISLLRKDKENIFLKIMDCFIGQ